MGTLEPGWMKRQFDIVEETVSRWPDSKQYASGLISKEEYEKRKATQEREGTSHLGLSTQHIAELRSKGIKI